MKNSYSLPLDNSYSSSAASHAHILHAADTFCYNILLFDKKVFTLGHTILWLNDFDSTLASKDCAILDIIVISGVVQE